MFRSLIEEKNQILAGLNGYNLSCPALTFLGSPWRYCWPSLPLRLCQEHLGTADKKEPWGRAPWEQCWRHLCALGTPWIQRASVQGENIQEQPFPPVLWDLPLSSPLLRRGYHPSSMDPDWNFQAWWCAWQRITGCRNKFSGSVFYYLFLFGQCWSYASPWRKQPWTHSSWNEEKWTLY